jgi:hypothetical protein
MRYRAIQGRNESDLTALSGIGSPWGISFLLHYGRRLRKLLAMTEAWTY